MIWKLKVNGLVNCNSLLNHRVLGNQNGSRRLVSASCCWIMLMVCAAVCERTLAQDKTIIVTTQFAVPNGGSITLAGVEHCRPTQPAFVDLVKAAPIVHARDRPTSKKLLEATRIENLRAQHPTSQSTSRHFLPHANMLCSVKINDKTGTTYDVFHDGKSMEFTVEKEGAIRVTLREKYLGVDSEELKKRFPDRAEELKLFDNFEGCCWVAFGTFTWETGHRFADFEEFKAKSPELFAIYEHYSQAKSVTLTMHVTPRIIIPEEEEELLGVHYRRP